MQLSPILSLCCFTSPMAEVQAQNSQSELSVDDPSYQVYLSRDNMIEISPVLRQLSVVSRTVFCGVSQHKHRKAKVHTLCMTLHKCSVKKKMPFLIKVFFLNFRHFSIQILPCLVSSLHCTAGEQQDAGGESMAWWLEVL